MWQDSTRVARRVSSTIYRAVVRPLVAAMVRVGSGRSRSVLQGRPSPRSGAAWGASCSAGRTIGGRRWRRAGPEGGLGGQLFGWPNDRGSTLASGRARGRLRGPAVRLAERSGVDAGVGRARGRLGGPAVRLAERSGRRWRRAGRGRTIGGRRWRRAGPRAAWGASCSAGRTIGVDAGVGRARGRLGGPAVRLAERSGGRRWRRAGPRAAWGASCSAGRTIGGRRWRRAGPRAVHKVPVEYPNLRSERDHRQAIEDQAPARGKRPRSRHPTRGVG